MALRSQWEQGLAVGRGGGRRRTLVEPCNGLEASSLVCSFNPGLTFMRPPHSWGLASESD